MGGGGRENVVRSRKRRWERRKGRRRNGNVVTPWNGGCRKIGMSCHGRDRVRQPLQERNEKRGLLVRVSFGYNFM